MSSGCTIPVAPVVRFSLPARIGWCRPVIAKSGTYPNQTLGSPASGGVFRACFPVPSFFAYRRRDGPFARDDAARDLSRGVTAALRRRTRALLAGVEGKAYGEGEFEDGPFLVASPFRPRLGGAFFLPGHDEASRQEKRDRRRAPVAGGSAARRGGGAAGRWGGVAIRRSGPPPLADAGTRGGGHARLHETSRRRGGSNRLRGGRAADTKRSTRGVGAAARGGVASTGVSGGGRPFCHRRSSPLAPGFW
ncbi:hypothetical protein GGQ59_002818 [Parvularcula dongshanensis]|uniref:Uncharacterized protein n=1 Tax=Parvularcula dongshanensis TaxID=1173995 RepID=A0A840I834_9PROT|nr:hypothetical protein [Parvularcula dongshanensis]